MFKQSGVKAAWTKPEGFHLTLHFFGEVAQPKIPEIMTTLTSMVKNTSAFQLSFSDAGAFPNVKNARVVWIGVSGETDKLLNLQSSVESSIVGLGFKRENRPFVPHLTLGRIKNIQSREEWLNGFNRVQHFKTQNFFVRTVHLMKSDLKPSGAVYTEIGSVDLL